MLIANARPWQALFLSFTPHFGLVSSYTTKCIQEINLHVLDPNGYQEWNDDDKPHYVQAMTGEDTEEYVAAMAKEIQQLESKQTWQIVNWTLF